MQIQTNPPKVCLHFVLGKPVTGWQIYCAIRKLVPERDAVFLQTEATNDRILCEIGVDDEHHLKDLVIAVNTPNQTNIDLEHPYSKIFVIFKPRYSNHHIGSYDTIEILATLSEFTKNLEDELKYRPINEIEETESYPSLEFEWENTLYTVKSKAFHTGKIVLPDGTLVRIKHVETNNSKRVIVEEIAHPYKGRRTPLALSREFKAELAQHVIDIPTPFLVVRQSKTGG